MAFSNKRKLRNCVHNYASLDLDRIGEHQLEQLNRIWEVASQKIDYYVRLKSDHGLPDRFDSLGFYRDSMPSLEKSVIRDGEISCSFSQPRPDFFRTTGGSTSSPVQMPAWKSEFEFTRADAWVGRSWFGVEPSDKLFLFWGHSHLLGQGFKGKFAALKRKLKDSVQNYYRYSCYDLSDRNLIAAGDAILKLKPKYIIGYSHALDRLARVNIRRSADFKELRIKAIIGTAESFPFEDSSTVLSDVFGAPVCMEYGAVETNVIAHSHPMGGYRVFWKNYLLDFAESSSGFQDVFVTSLYDRCTPLFRYRIGDLVAVGGQSLVSQGASLLSFDKVIGRSNQLIITPSGRQLHSEAISHAVRSISDIIAYQFECSNDCVKLKLVTRKNLDQSAINDIFRNADKIDPDFSKSLQVCFVDSIERTIAGKTPTVVWKL